MIQINSGEKLFRCDNGRVYVLPKHHCAFCGECHHIFWDYTNGPYWFFCDADHDTNAGEIGECPYFKEET